MEKVVFMLRKKKVNTLLGYKISLSFSIYQHSRDEILLRKIAYKNN